MSIQPLILKNGIISPPRSPTDVSALLVSINLNNVNNTSDLNKPISTATQTALDLKANLVSPNFSGTPTTPTATAGTNTTQVANCAFVSTAISSLVASSPAALDTLNELAAALGNDANFSTTVTNSLASKVDLTTNQTVSGIKTFSSGLVLPSSSGSSVSSIWRNVDNLEYKDSNNTTRVVLNSAGNLSNLASRQTSLNNLVGTQTANRVLRSNGTDVALALVALDTDVTNTLPITFGGTGSNTQNFVDLSTNQSNIDGSKTFLKALNVPQVFSGYVSNSSNKALGDSDFVNPQMAKTFNFFGVDYTPSADPGTTCSLLSSDISVLGSTNLTSIATGGFFRVRHLGTSTLSTVQGLRLIGLNFSTGTVSNLTGAYFAARNDSTGTVTNLIGGDFVATSGSAGTATNLIGGRFTASITNASATTTTLIGVQAIVSSNNTTPATTAIGVDISNITGTATSKIPLRVGTGGSSYFNDTTASTSTTTGAVIFAGGIGVAGTVNASILNASTQINVAGTKILGTQSTGWTAGTGTPNKSTFAADTATAVQAAQRVLALEQMLRTHGLIN